MARRVILASLVLAGMTTACITPISDYHGYNPDEILPKDVTPGIDTRASVLAQLGSPSTESIFDENTWFYISTQRERLAFMVPKTKHRQITALRFSEADVVEEVLTYDETDGQVISYVSRETPTRGRELGLLEQIFGSIGNVALPQTDEATPNNPTGRR
ncbi:MAG: outer membrane protein assembly factor BamE [Alphaproteobacteria bacterium]|jgi:outer membrane protein assembly factor BamE (lipoprotein component of BamABCDE complex)|nr:outer membrane protein assembly factor BamE [Alphaproteobacteria bacterium]